MSLADPLIRSRDIKRYAAEFSAMTLHRHILAGRFPSPATINGLGVAAFGPDRVARWSAKRLGPRPGHRCASRTHGASARRSHTEIRPDRTRHCIARLFQPDQQKQGARFGGPT